MKANKDPKVQIKETDKNFYHLEHKRIIVDSTGKHPQIDLRVQTYSRKEYNNLLAWIGKNGLGALGDDEIRVVHDPILQGELEAKAKEKAEAAESKKLKAEKAKAEKVVPKI